MNLNIKIWPTDFNPGHITRRTDAQMKTAFRHYLQAEGFDITREQWSVLHRIFEMEGIQQSALADETEKDRHNITRILNRLIRDKLVKRLPDPNDKRRYNVYLTKKGKDVVVKLYPMVVDFLEKSFEGLTQDDFQSFIRIHEHIFKNLEALQNGKSKQGNQKLSNSG